MVVSTWSLERPNLTILFMSNSLGSSGLNSGSNFGSSDSSDIDNTDLLFIPWTRFVHGALSLELNVNAETEAINASRSKARVCMLNWSYKDRCYTRGSRISNFGSGWLDRFNNVNLHAIWGWVMCVFSIRSATELKMWRRFLESSDVSLKIFVKSSFWDLGSKSVA